MSGRSFEFVKRCKTWQSDRVFFFDDSGELANLPAEWTDVVPADPFVVVSAGRSPFRTADLLVLAELVARLGGVRVLPARVSRGFCRDCPADSAEHRRTGPSSPLGYPVNVTVSW